MIMIKPESTCENEEMSDVIKNIVLNYIEDVGTSEECSYEIMQCLRSLEKKSEFNTISRPSHYIEGRIYEPRKVIEDWGLGFNLGNALKYISRAGRKGDKIEDLQKAIQYIDFEIEKNRGG